MPLSFCRTSLSHRHYERRKFMDVLEGGGRTVSTQNGRVVLDGEIADRHHPHRFVSLDDRKATNRRWSMPRTHRKRGSALMISGAITYSSSTTLGCTFGIVFHARIAAEGEGWDIDDVAAETVDDPASVGALAADAILPEDF